MNKMKTTILKKHMDAEYSMSDTKRERHTKEDNKNNINIKRLKCLWRVSIVLLLLLNM